MNALQALRDSFAHILTTTLWWLSTIIRVPATACLLACAVATAWPVYQVVADTDVVYVNIGRVWQPLDLEDGTSWADAFRFLQDAIGEADARLNSPNPPEKVEIWVAAAFDGNDDPIPYRPDQSLIHSACGDEGPPGFGCCPPWGNCYASNTFNLRDNVGIFGGFVGTETSRDQRRPLENITILSGDTGSGTINRVVRGVGNNATARLDGFHIVGAIGEVGGAVLLLDGSFILSNCHLYDNIAWWGAGIFVFRGAPSIINCVIRDNECNFGRGAVFITDGHETFADQVHATLVNCLIHNNIGSSSGGNHPLGIGVAITSCNVLPGIDWRRVIGRRIEQ